MFNWVNLKEFISGNLKIRIILGMSIILLMVLGTFSYFDMVTQVSRYTEEHKKMAMEISDTVMKSIEYPMLDGKMDQVQAILEKLGTLEDMELVHLCDDTGIIKRNGKEPNDIKRKTKSNMTLKVFKTGKLAHGLEMRHHNDVDARILRYAIPVHNEKACYKCHGDKKPLLGVLSVGFSWEPIQQKVASVRNQNILRAITSIVIVGFFLTLWLNKYTIRPIIQLTEITDEISSGKYASAFEKFPERSVWCRELLNCDKTNCPAYKNNSIPCWYMSDTLRFAEPSGKFPEKLDRCVKCSVYQDHKGDRIVRLQDSFRHMLYKLISYEEELKASEAQLVQAGKMTTIGTMVFGIAHELNQPLNVIKIGGDFLLKIIKRGEKIDLEELKTVSEEISSQVVRASGIINHLRTFSRVSGPARSPVDINNPIRDVFKVLGQRLRLHQIDVTLELPKNLPPIMADHNRLEQFFINLMTNAVDAIDEKVEKMGSGVKKSVTIKSFLKNGWVVVTVSDTGTGISDSNRDKIFEPFFTTKKVGKGTGLGMYVSYRIIKDYGGRITVNSKIDEGTTFEISFPAVSEKSETQPK